MIQLNDISKTYKTRQGEINALNEIALHIDEGEFTVVRGPSGCGKTTLLLAIGGMLHPTRGTIQIGGVDPYALSVKDRAEFRAKNIGFVFQMFHLIPYLTALENVLTASRNGTAQNTRKTALELLEKLGLSGREHHTPAELSAGERQRAAIARALINQPTLILADEPTGNLDPDNAAEVIRHLSEYQKAGGTVIFVTHSTSADQTANRIIQMQTGRILDS